jgi:hypothetical protein
LQIYLFLSSPHLHHTHSPASFSYMLDVFTLCKSLCNYSSCTYFFCFTCISLLFSVSILFNFLVSPFSGIRNLVYDSSTFTGQIT